MAGRITAAYRAFDMRAAVMDIESLTGVGGAAKVTAAADPNDVAVEVSSGGPLEIVWDTVARMYYQLLEQVPLLMAGLLIVLLTWVIAKAFDHFEGRLLNRFRLRASQRTLISWLTSIALWIIGLLTAATVVFPGLTPAKALAALGLGSIAVGLAFKDIFENFFAGMLILWRFPFENGDWIECEGVEGRVVDVTIRNTLLRRPSGELVVFPNSTIFNNTVDVLTNKPLRRVSVIAGVAYGENVDESRAVIKEAVERCKTVSDEKPVEIFAKEFADSSINFEVAWWTQPAPLDIRRSRDEVVAAVKAALDAAGIEIPFPYRTLTFKGPIQIATREESADEQGDGNAL